MWYSVVDPNSPGYKNKVVASFERYDEAELFAHECEGRYCPVVLRLPRQLTAYRRRQLSATEATWSPFFVVSTLTKPSIGEVINPSCLAEDERW